MPLQKSSQPLPTMDQRCSREGTCVWLLLWIDWMRMVGVVVVVLENDGKSV